MPKYELRLFRTARTGANIHHPPHRIIPIEAADDDAARSAADAEIERFTDFNDDKLAALFGEGDRDLNFVRRGRS